MRIKLKVMNFCFIGLIALLLISLIVTVSVIANKNAKIEELKLKSIETAGSISEKTEKEKELQEKLEQSEKEKSDIQAKLEASESEKSRLEAENGNLRTQIEQLKAAKREARLQSALNAAAISPPNPNSDKICYLTFDDGPSNNTLEILKILKKYHIKATFFVINTAKIDYVKDIHAGGHTVGLHTASHRYDEIYKSVDAYFNDLNTISNIVESKIGVKSKVIRFPGGTSNGVSGKYCSGIMTTLSNEVVARGFSYFDWNVASGDASSKKVPAATIVNNVVNQSKNKNQICVLMHDASSKSTTVAALEDMVAELILLGFRFEPLTTDVQVPGFRHAPNN